MRKSVLQKSTKIRTDLDLIESKIEQIGNMILSHNLLNKDCNPQASRKKNRTTANDLSLLNPKLKELKQYYARKAYFALKESILSTLQFLAESCGLTIGQDFFEKDISQKNSNNNSKHEKPSTMKAKDHFDEKHNLKLNFVDKQKKAQLLE